MMQQTHTNIPSLQHRDFDWLNTVTGKCLNQRKINDEKYTARNSLSDLFPEELFVTMSL